MASELPDEADAFRSEAATNLACQREENDMRLCRWGAELLVSGRFVLTRPLESGTVNFRSQETHLPCPRQRRPQRCIANDSATPVAREAPCNHVELATVIGEHAWHCQVAQVASVA